MHSFFDVKIEKRDDFDVMTEREIISIQNIFFDVAIDITNEIFENEISIIDFDEIINNININVDSFVDKNVAKNDDIVIIVFDIKKNVDFDANIAINIVFANSFVVILTNSLDIIKLNDKNIANSIANFFA